MTQLVDQVSRYIDRSTVGFFEDWESQYIAADRWTPLTTDSSSAATLVLVDKTATNGILSITQDATDNDEIYFQTTVMPFLIASGRPMFYEIRLNSAELATSTNNVMVGFLSGVAAANQLIDDGAGPIASATMAVIYKVDGGVLWRCRSQIGAAVGQTDTISQHSSSSAAGVYSVLRIEVQPVSSTLAEVVYSIDDGTSGMRQMMDANDNPIKHQLTYTNAVACGAWFGCKTGGAQAEVLLVDYVTAWQKR